MNTELPKPSVVSASILAIDPGADMGWAVFRGIMLCDCGLGDVPDYARRPDVLVIERPWIRPQRYSKADPNDLIELAIKVGQATRDYAPRRELITYAPHVWKGSATKDQVKAKVLPALSSDERNVLRRGWSTAPPSKQHNVTEAVGLGLHFLGLL